MKQLKFYLIAFVGCILFTACGGDDSEGLTPEESRKVYTEMYNIPAEGCNVSYTLKTLNTKISSVCAATDRS